MMMFDLLRKKRKKKPASRSEELPPSASVCRNESPLRTPVSKEDASANSSVDEVPTLVPQLPLPPTEGLPEPKEEGETEEDGPNDDQAWGRETTKQKEERIAAQIRRRRGLEEEEFTESSLPVRRPVRTVCQSCRRDIQINDNTHRVICDARGKHHFCRQCINLHAEAWINGQKEYELRKVKHGTWRGLYAMPCICSDCQTGCLQEVLLRPVLSPSIYTNFRQKLIRARSERSNSKSSDNTIMSQTNAPTQPPLNPLELTDSPPRMLKDTNPQQYNLQPEESDPRYIVRQWKQQRQQELEEGLQESHKALSLLEQQIMRNRHRLFQQQLGSFRSLPEMDSSREKPVSSYRSFSAPEKPRSQYRSLYRSCGESPPQTLAPQRATTLATSNSSQNRSVWRQDHSSSTRSLPPTGREILSLFTEEQLQPEPTALRAVGVANQIGSSSLNHTKEASTSVKNEVVRPLDSSDDTEPPALSDEASAVITCQCCYEDFAPSDSNTSILYCERARLADAESHSFCAKCVRSYVEEWLFGTATVTPRPGRDNNGEATSVFPCLFGECTDGGLPDQEVKKALSTTSMEKYVEKFSVLRTREGDDEERLLQVAIRLSLQQQEMQKRVEQLEREQLELSFSKLPKNMVSVGIPASEAGKAVNTSSSTLPMPSPRSSVASADQIRDNYEKSLHVVEEAMSEAKFRTCSKCSTKFLKDEDFCNKLKCPSCATAICYICRKVLPSKGYDHFCIHQRGGCKACVGSHCPLWTDVDQDNERDQAEMRERGLDAANRVWEESLLEDSPGAHEEVRVDVDKLLEKPPPPRVD